MYSMAMARERLVHLGGMHGEVSCTRECLNVGRREKRRPLHHREP